MKTTVMKLFYYSFKNEPSSYKMVNHKEILSRLKFIGKIERGNKINTKHVYIQQDTIITAISRTFFRPDSRWNTIKFIQDTISRSFEIIDTYENSLRQFEHGVIKHIVQDLKMSKKGIANLKITYIEDTKFISDIDTILNLLNSKLDVVLKKYPELYIESDSETESETE